MKYVVASKMPFCIRRAGFLRNDDSSYDCANQWSDGSVFALLVGVYHVHIVIG